jgi:hypothetical protein
LLSHTSDGGILLQLSQELVWLFQVPSHIIGSVIEHLAEQVSAPFNAMFNLVGEVSEGAHGDGLLRGILGISIALGLVGNHHLGVGFGAEGSRFKERFLVPDALGVNIKTSFDVINCINNKV